jgi:hypothetical protein
MKTLEFFLAATCCVLYAAAGVAFSVWAGGPIVPYCFAVSACFGGAAFYLYTRKSG